MCGVFMLCGTDNSAVAWNEKEFKVMRGFAITTGFKVACVTLETTNFPNIYFQTEVISLVGV